MKDGGYLMIDDRMAGGPRALFESVTYTCNHCHAIVVKNPERQRERHVCRGCSRVICDVCAEIRAATLQCVTMDRKIDEALTAAEKRAPEDPFIQLR